MYGLSLSIGVIPGLWTFHPSLPNSWLLLGTLFAWSAERGSRLLSKETVRASYHQGHTRVWIVKSGIWLCMSRDDFCLPPEGMHSGIWGKGNVTWDCGREVSFFYRVETLLGPPGDCAARVCLCLVSVRVVMYVPASECPWRPSYRPLPYGETVVFLQV